MSDLTQQLETHLARYRPAIVAEMRDLFRAGRTSSPFWGMMQYHMGWVNRDFEPEQSDAGKMIRPSLLLLCCESAGGDWQQALPAAAAVEILHNFSLVHDDIEDRSPLRRGRPTVWQLWGEAQAINTGDAMFSLSQLAVTRLHERGVDAETTVTAMRRLNETCIELTEGQHDDMRFETLDAVTTDEYLQMVRGKTAVLIALSAELGARVAGVSAELIDHYSQFGLSLGLAFQVIDDILGVWGDEALIGKSSASDILTKKKSLPIVYGLERSSQLREHYLQPADSPQYVEHATAMLDQVDARPYAETLAKKHSHAALHHLEAADPSGPAAEALQQLTHMLLHRQK